jgi:hypothetical protein
MSDCELLVSLSMMPQLFGVAQQTAWRWNTSAGGPGRLPAPDLVVDEKPLWFESTVREWAQSRRSKLTVDEKVMAQIRVRQTGGNV